MVFFLFSINKQGDFDTLLFHDVLLSANASSGIKHVTNGSLQSSIFTIVNLSNCGAVYSVTVTKVSDIIRKA